MWHWVSHWAHYNALTAGLELDGVEWAHRWFSEGDTWAHHCLEMNNSPLLSKYSIILRRFPFILGRYRRTKNIPPNPSFSSSPRSVHAWCHAVLRPVAAHLSVYLWMHVGRFASLSLSVNVDSSIFSQLIIQRVCRLCFHLSHLRTRLWKNP